MQLHNIIKVLKNISKLVRTVVHNNQQSSYWLCIYCSRTFVQDQSISHCHNF